MNKKRFTLLVMIVAIAIIILIVLLLSLLSKNKVQNEDDDIHLANLEFLNNIEEKKEIAKLEYNQYNLQTIGDQDITNIYFNDYKYYAVYHPEEAYQLLNKEYRELKFGSLENYKQYAQKYMDEIFKSVIKSFNVSTWENGKQYIAIDKSGKYYIFQETVPMQYTVILDTYTIDLPEFTEKYKKASNENKVLMNIQRFFEAVNSQDYKYAYNKLDETFRTNNFKTQSDFENYMKKNFYTKNKLEAGKIEKQNDLYLYQITASDEADSSKSVTKTFVMQLKKETDFVMSFNI